MEGLFSSGIGHDSSCFWLFLCTLMFQNPSKISTLTLVLNTMIVAQVAKEEFNRLHIVKDPWVHIEWGKSYLREVLRYCLREPCQAVVTMPILLNTGSDSWPGFILHAKQAPFSKTFLKRPSACSKWPKFGLMIWAERLWWPCILSDLKTFKCTFEVSTRAEVFVVFVLGGACLEFSFHFHQ